MTATNTILINRFKITRTRTKYIQHFRVQKIQNDKTGTEFIQLTVSCTDTEHSSRVQHSATLQVIRFDRTFDCSVTRATLIATMTLAHPVQSISPPYKWRGVGLLSAARRRVLGEVVATALVLGLTLQARNNRSS